MFEPIKALVEHVWPTRYYLWYIDGKPVHLTMAQCIDEMEREALKRSLRSLAVSK
jgi:hypothetical protein